MESAKEAGELAVVTGSCLERNLVPMLARTRRVKELEPLVHVCGTLK